MEDFTHKTNPKGFARIIEPTCQKFTWFENGEAHGNTKMVTFNKEENLM